ncbi:MAG: transporter substrate-binding domain-containing protein [Burkholderiales bacterium]|nr:transporter substrate-binding domain-containing protein [Burkholderiales bacterium]
MDHGHLTGVSAELVDELARRQGVTIAGELVPYARAVREVNGRPDVLVAQIGRTPVREGKYLWLAPLFEEPFLVYVRKDGKIDPDIITGSRHGAVGVLRDALSDELAKSLGIASLDPSSDEATNARKLQAGHIDAWLASKNTAEFAMRQANMDPSEVAHGPVLRTYTLYLVSGRGRAGMSTAGWAKVLEEMKADGTYQRILAHYGYEQ